MPGGFSSGFSSGFGITRLARSASGLLFRDDFNRGDGMVGKDYTVQAGTWVIEGGRLKWPASATQGVLRLTAAGQIKNSHVQVVVTKSPNLNDYGTLLTRYQVSPEQAYIFDIAGAGDGTDPNKARIIRDNTGGLTRLTGGYAPPGYGVGVPTRYTVSTITGAHKFWIDGILALTSADSTAANDIVGWVAFDAIPQGTHCDIFWDQIVVCTSRILSVTGLPAGYTFRANGITSAASDGVNPTTIDLLGTVLPVTLLEVLNPSNAVVHSEYSDIYGGDTWAYSPFNSYIVAGSGGVVVGGSSPVTGTHYVTGSGGVQIGGSATISRRKVYTPAGGVLIGGGHAPSVGRAYVGSGGITIGLGGGSSPVSYYRAPTIIFQRRRLYSGPAEVGDRSIDVPVEGMVVTRIGAVGVLTPREEGAVGTKEPKPPAGGGGQLLVESWFRIGSGGVRVGGSSPIAYYHGDGGPGTTPTSYTAWGTGGVAVGGSSPVTTSTARRYSVTGSGGVKIAGSSPVNAVTRRSYARTGSGGVLIRGSSPFSYTQAPTVPGGGGGTGVFRTPTPAVNWGPTARPVPIVTGATYNVTTQAQWNTALAACTWGDEIVLANGLNILGTIILPNKGAYAGGWITIRTAGVDAVCPAGRRMNVAKADTIGLARIKSPGANANALQMAAGARGYRIIGVEWECGSDVSAIAHLGYLGLTSFAQAAGHIVIDRCLYRGQTTFFCNRPFYACGTYVAVIDSHLVDIYGNGDAQSVLIAGCEGPYYLDNNTFHGWGENWMSGGAESALTDIHGVPSDIVVTHNYFTKNLTYRYANPIPNTAAEKNLNECKTGRRVEIAWNIMEYQWPPGQNAASNFKSVDQSGGHPLQGLQDLHYHHNWIRYASGGVKYASNPQNPTNQINPLHRCYEHDNLYEFINTDPRFNGSGIMLMLSGGISDVTVEHCTWVASSANGATSIIVEPTAVGPVAVLNNIIWADGYGMKMSGQIEGTNSWNAFVPNAAWRTFTNNCLIGLNPPLSQYPPGNFTRANDAAVGYANLAGRDYTVTGVLATAATDGGPVGVSNFAALMSGLAPVLNG